jgi:hypothetical protein
VTARDTIAPPPQSEVPAPIPPAPGLPSIQSTPVPDAAHDPVRDRMRVVGDRVIYSIALGCATWLKAHGHLDWDVAALILLVSGVRPANLLDVLAARGGGRGASLVVAGLSLHDVRRIFGT